MFLVLLVLSLSSFSKTFLSLSLSSFSLYATHTLPTSLFNYFIISPPNSSIPLPNSFFPSPLQNPPIKTSNNHQEWKNPAAPTANAPKPPLEGNPLPPPPFALLPNRRPMPPCIFLVTSPTQSQNRGILNTTNLESLLSLSFWI